MSTTSKFQAYIVAPIEAMQLPLPFENYKKPPETWVDPNVPEYYSLAEIDGTNLLGRPINIRKSLDGKWFIYSDSDFSYRAGHFKALEDMGTALGIPVYILTTEKEVQDELNGTAGTLQIAQWTDPNAGVV